MTVKLNGPSERLGKVKLSNEFASWQIDSPEARLNRGLGKLAANSVRLDAGTYPLLEDRGDMRAMFVEREDFALGREESKNLVRFGQLLLNGNGVHEEPDLVAIKNFDDREGLYTEWAASSYVNALFDEQRAFLPLGVLKDSEGQEGIISLYEHGVKTADNVFWADKELDPDALNKEVILRTARLCMYGLGMLHGSRLIHGDAQAKNLGYDRHVRFIDLEGASLIAPDAVTDEDVQRKIIRDITVFIDSTAQVDENRNEISEVLSKPDTIEAMLSSYEAGVTKAREQQDGIYIPNFAEVHRDEIRSVIEKVHK